MGRKPAFALALSVVLFGGCMVGGPQPDRSSSSVSGGATWFLVADSARLAGEDLAGEPWCQAGSPAVRLVVTAGGQLRGETPEAPGLEPRWNARLFPVQTSQLRSGLRVELIGRCD